MSFIPSQLYYFAGTLIGGMVVCFLYITFIMFLLQKLHRSVMLSALGATGRMALTNYLLQSIIATTVFYGYGLGLYGRFGPAAGIGLTLVIFTLQVYFSRRWLQRHHFGPLEWVWRTLTYGEMQPFGK